MTHLVPGARLALRAAIIYAPFWAIAGPSPAKAVPLLQIYVEGATYDASTETWIAPPGEDPIRLWAIGNLTGAGGKGTISDVKLSVAYRANDEPVTVTLTESTTGGYGGFTDNSLANTASFVQKVTDGSVPLLGDGGNLPSHGVYGPGVYWQEFSLGDFSVPGDSPIIDFAAPLPTPVSSNTDAVINVYEVAISGPSDEIEIHFDLYDHVAGKHHAQYKFAPFSHDGGGGALLGSNPEPSTFLLAILGLLSLGMTRRRRRR